MNKILHKLLKSNTLLFVIYLIISSNIFAKNLEIYPFTIAASLQTESVYENNVYFTRDDQKSNFSNIFKPNISIIFNEKNTTKTSKHKFSLIYNPELVKSNISKFDTIRQNANTSLYLIFPLGLNINLKNSYKDTDSSPSSEIVEKIKRTQNDFYGNAEFDCKNNFLIAYSFNSVINKYKEEPYTTQLSYTDNKNAMRISYKLFPKTKIFTEFSVGKIEYTSANNNNNDSDYVKYDLGINGSLTPKTNGTISIGGQKKDYISQNINVESFMYSLLTTTNISSNKKLKLQFNKTTVESIYRNNLYYISNKFTANLSNKFAKKWEFNPILSYELASYPNATANTTRTDDIKTLNFNTYYILNKNAKIGLNYCIKQRDSNIDSINYLSNSVACILDIGF